MVETATVTKLGLQVLACRQSDDLTTDSASSTESKEDEGSSDDEYIKKSPHTKQAEATVMKALKTANNECEELLHYFNGHAINPDNRQSTLCSIEELCAKKKPDLGASFTELLDIVQLLAKEKAVDGLSIWKHFYLRLLTKDAKQSGLQPLDAEGIVLDDFSYVRQLILGGPVVGSSTSGLDDDDIEASASSKDAAKKYKEAYEAFTSAIPDAAMPDGVSIGMGPVQFHKNIGKTEREPPVVNNYHAGSGDHHYHAPVYVAAAGSFRNGKVYFGRGGATAFGQGSEAAFTEE